MTTNYNLVVLDLDGTLTNSKKELSERNRTTLIRLQQQGVRIVLASGRPTYGIVPIAEQLELATYGGYILAYNGGVIIECATMQTLYSNVLPSELLPTLYRESVAAGCTILSYDNEYIVTENPSDEYVVFEAHLNKMQTKQTADFVNYFSEPLPKCLTVGDPARILALEGSLKAVIGDKMNIYRSEPFFLELVPQGIDKAYSLGVLLEKIGDSKEQMIAFGDGFNDLSMIVYAGCGVAMANAQEAVKEQADDVALSNDDDGVAIYIEQHLLPTM